MKKKPVIISVVGLTVALGIGIVVGSLASSPSEGTSNAAPASTYATAPTLSSIIAPTTTRPKTTTPSRTTTQETTPPSIVTPVGEPTRATVPAGYTRIYSLDFKLGSEWVVDETSRTPGRTLVYASACAGDKSACPGFAVSDPTQADNKIPFNLDAAVEIPDQKSGGKCYQDFLHNNTYFGQPKKVATTSIDGRLINHMVQYECNQTPEASSDWVHSWTINNVVVVDTHPSSHEPTPGLVALFSNGGLRIVR